MVGSLVQQVGVCSAVLMVLSDTHLVYVVVWFLKLAWKFFMGRLSELGSILYVGMMNWDLYQRIYE
jgi:hypothetical protein